MTPDTKSALFIQKGEYSQGEPLVRDRGFFINDERFGGWAKWSEQTFETETHLVGPKIYSKVFELLLRLKANNLWPAMHPGTQAFNGDPENARFRTTSLFYGLTISRAIFGISVIRKSADAPVALAYITTFRITAIRQVGAFLQMET